MSFMPMDPSNPLYRLLNPGMPAGGIGGGMGGFGGLFGRGPSWLGNGAEMGQQPRAGLRGLLQDPNLGLALLANSGPSAQPRSFGQIFGQSALQAKQIAQDQEDADFKRKYMEAQMGAMGRDRQGKPIIVAGPDGKPVYVPEDQAVGKSPYLTAQDGVGDYQPGDYTTESWAQYVKTKDPGVLQRYTTPRQEFSPSFQNVFRTNPDGSTQQGTFNTRTGEYNWTGSLVPAGTKSRVDASGTAQGKVEGDRVAKSGRAYDTFKVGVGSLDKAMENTWTGPVMGRLPAVTAEQQIAEGAEANMAPILKNLFRDSGEGTFTEGDQALLLKMAPTRKDLPEARKAKIEMIDAIVKAKLGIADQAQQPSSGVPSAATGGASGASAPAKISGDADYNALPSGAEFIGPDGKRRRKP